MAPFRDPKVTGNPAITLAITRYGGHCGFVEAARDGYDGYWAEREIVDFAARHVPPALLPQAAALEWAHESLCLALILVGVLVASPPGAARPRRRPASASSP